MDKYKPRVQDADDSNSRASSGIAQSMNHHHQLDKLTVMEKRFPNFPLVLLVDATNLSKSFHREGTIYFSNELRIVVDCRMFSAVGRCYLVSIITV